ncbi:MAG: hypothetical protein K2O06_14825 [Acetatifactor sp.]|nr:hypothetical protein [Acetatifactor sp.]
MKGKKIAGGVRRTAMLGLAGCLLAGGSMQVCAATLKDVFDERYYADTYEDLKEAFGYDREMLWNHFVAYGLNEGRNMNGLIDVVKYRAEYADLNEAFGDDWDAYLNHYLAYGAKEGRNTGTGFNALDYAGRYEDLQEAFGEDVLALWQHYQVSGAAEGREARDERIVAAEEKAKRAQESVSKPSGSQKPSEGQDYVERIELENGGWIIRTVNSNGGVETDEYNSTGKCVKITYAEDGKERTVVDFYSENGIDVRRQMDYDEDGNIRSHCEWRYGSDGRWLSHKDYNRDGSAVEYTYDEYDSNGDYVRWSYHEYDKDGREVHTEYFSR